MENCSSHAKRRGKETKSCRTEEIIQIRTEIKGVRQKKKKRERERALIRHTKKSTEDDIDN